tara:strand:- start:1226 stop:1492 length:267 start_codon:yes stop_codon:yes gene_type:complete
MYERLITPLVAFLAVNAGYQKFDAGYYRCSTTTHIFGMLFPLFILYVLWGLKENCMNTFNKTVLLFLSWSMLFFHLLYEHDKNTKPPQ